MSRVQNGCAAVGLVVGLSTAVLPTASAAVGTPPPVSAARVGAVTTTTASLSWTDPRSSRFALTVVRIARGTRAPATVRSGTAVGTVSRSGHSTVARRLIAGTRYTVALFAGDGHGHYARGVALAATTGPAPVRSLSSRSTSTMITLSWTNPTTASFAGSVIRWAVGTRAPATPKAGTGVRLSTPRARSARVTGLTPSQRYAFSVWTRDRSLHYSDVVHASVRTAPPPPPPPPPPPGPPDQPVLDALTADAGAPSEYSAPEASGRSGVVYTYDTTRTLVQTVGIAGATLSLTTAAGDALTLTIPPHAVASDTQIVATPVSTLSGAVEAGGTPLGLELKPEGLVLLQPAMLDVTPAGGLVARRAIGIETAGDATATRPAVILPDATKLSMPVQHFSDHLILVSNGENGWTSPYFSQPEMTVSVETRIAALLEDARDQMLDGQNPDYVPRLITLLDEQYTSTIEPIINRSIGDCTYAESHYATALSYARSRILLGVDDAAKSTAILNGMVSSLQNCWTTKTRTCMTPDPKRFGSLLATARTMAVFGVLTAGGKDANPLDPSQVTWCGTANGYVDVTITRSRNAGNFDALETNHFRYWVNADRYVDDQGGGAYRIALIDKGSVLDMNYNYLSHVSYGANCFGTSKAALQLYAEPTKFTGLQTFTSADVSSGAIEFGFFGTDRIWTIPMDIADNCESATDNAYAQPALDIDHTDHVDRATGDWTTSVDTTITDGSGWTTRTQMSALIHLDNLAHLLPAP